MSARIELIFLAFQPSVTFAGVVRTYVCFRWGGADVRVLSLGWCGCTCANQATFISGVLRLQLALTQLHDGELLFFKLPCNCFCCNTLSTERSNYAWKLKRALLRYQWEHCSAIPVGTLRYQSGKTQLQWTEMQRRAGNGPAIDFLQWRFHRRGCSR